MTVVALPHIEDPITEEPELIAGLVPAKGQLVIAGETETGKSLTAIEICHALLTGEPLWETLPVLQTVERVLYVLGEHYPATIRRQWLRMGLPTPAGRFNLVGPDLLPDHALVDNGVLQKHTIAKLAQWAKGRGVVVFDPLASFVRGVGAENDNAVMRQVIEIMTLIAQTAGALALIPAHAGKPQMVKGKEMSRTRYLLRGASAAEDAATNLFYLLAEEDDVATGYQRFALVKRKYKGQAPDAYQLARHPETGRQRIFPGAKEFGRLLHEEKRERLEHAVERLREAYGWTKDDAVRALGLMDGSSTSAVYRALRPRPNDNLAQKAA